ncbi:MAG TPA: hypothetical protein VGK43_06310 [Solirubrobacterales bacterium]
MASRLEALFYGLTNALAATGIGYSVAFEGFGRGWLFLAAISTFIAIAFAAKLGVLSAQQKGEHRG